MAPTAGKESGLDGAESSCTTPLATPTATPIATPMSTRSVKWEKDVEDAAGALQRPLLYQRGTNTTSQMAIVGANTCPIESLDYEYACMPLCFHILYFSYILTATGLLITSSTLDVIILFEFINRGRFSPRHISEFDV